MDADENVDSPGEVFRVPAIPVKRKKSLNSQNQNNDLSLISTASTSHESTTMESMNEEELLCKIDRVKSFINVVKARQQFQTAVINSSRRASNTLCQSGVQEIVVDITQNNLEYKKNISSHWSLIRNKQLQSIAHRNVMTLRSKNVCNFDDSALTRNAELLTKEWVAASNQNNDFKKQTLKIKSDAINKQMSLIHAINELPLEQLQERENSIPKGEINLLKRKEQNINFLQTFLCGALFDCRGTEEIVTDPKLMEMYLKCKGDQTFV